jgi:hypothetical protein
MGGMAIWQTARMKGEAVGRAHSGDIVPTGAAGQGRVGAKGEIEEGAETKVRECAVEVGLFPRVPASRAALDLKVGV